MSILGTAGTLSLIILFYVLARLSERFGAVVRMQPRYRYLYVSILLVLISFIIHILAVSAETTTTDTTWLTNPWVLLVVYYLPHTIAISLALYVAWHYWSWLITERSD
ncbi:MAG: hypothetical protein JXM69_05660 [Anaerolineae bacterium]|nr:hypothetical protein [Anaerolineae bacterium]